jgi:uncharacterized membrane protein
MTDPGGDNEPEAEGRGLLSAIHLSLSARMRAYFIAGVLITAPTALTLYLLWQFISAVDSAITPLIPESINPNAHLPFHIPGFGLIVAIAGLTVIGALTAGFIGRILLSISEGMLARMPVVRSVYGAIKQVVETILAQRSSAFRQVALVQFPHPGMWSVGFVAGPTLDELNRSAGGDLVGVYVPTTPNPTSGYLVYVPRAEVKILSMTVEDALKLVVSCGIISPPERTNGAVPAQREARLANHKIQTK